MFKSFSILVIGSLPDLNKPKTFGGTTVLMKDFSDYVIENKLNDIKMLNANPFSFKGSFILNSFVLFFKCIVLIPRSKSIMFNAASNGAFYVSPFIYFYTKLWSKKYIFRMFGGNLVDLLESKNSLIVKLFFRTTIKSNLIYVETKYLLSYLKNYNSNVKWFPNVRKIDKVWKKNTDSYDKRFVFISHVKKSKGVGELISVFSQLNQSYTIDLYGPEKDDILKESRLSKNVRYKGALEPRKVLKILANYDVLILPTYHEGEGYPGIIIEAFSQGIPIITTNWKSIPEIVNNDLGILIEPKSTIDLKKAIEYFNNSNYEKFSKNALKQFEIFDSDKVNNSIIKEIKSL